MTRANDVRTVATDDTSTARAESVSGASQQDGEADG